MYVFFCFCFVVFTVFTLSAHTSNYTNIPTGRLFFFNANKRTMKHRNKQTDVIVHSLPPCWRLTSVVGGRPFATGNDELFVQWRSTISRVCCCTSGRAAAGPQNHLGHRSGKFQSECDKFIALDILCILRPSVWHLLWESGHAGPLLGCAFGSIHLCGRPTFLDFWSI